MKRWVTLAGLCFGALCLCLAGLAVAPGVGQDAWAQPAPAPQPPQPGGPGAIPSPPAERPGGPGMGSGPGPGQGPGGPPGQPRRPVVRPGQLPPGHPPLPGMQQPPAPPPAAPAADAGHGHQTHCPGHGPMDPPGHVNWYQGLLGVDNVKSQSSSMLDRLLWRYKNDSDPCDPKNQPPPFLAVLINFGIFAFVLVRYGRKPLVEALAKRKKTIMADIDAATKLRDEAEDRLEEFEGKLDTVEDRLELLIKEHAEQAAREKDRIVAEAVEVRVRLRRDAEFRIEQELKAAKEQLLREAVHGAVLAAEKLIEARVTAADLDRVAEEYLMTVGPAIAAEVSVRPAAGEGGAR